MLDNYLIVNKKILPEYFEKVLEARKLLESGAAKDVTDAVKQSGISRSTYYKYKDYILEMDEVSESRTAVISVMLSHEPGKLSALLTKISDVGASVITITQAPPIRGRAEVTISLDVSRIKCELEDLIASVGAKLIAVE